MFDNIKQVARLREQYPQGTRVRLIFMDDIYTKLKAGDQGTVEFVDDIGTIHVRWDTGSGLGLVPGVDRFEKI